MSSINSEEIKNTPQRTIPIINTPPFSCSQAQEDIVKAYHKKHNSTKQSLPHKNELGEIKREWQNVCREQNNSEQNNFINKVGAFLIRWELGEVVPSYLKTPKFYGNGFEIITQNLLKIENIHSRLAKSRINKGFLCFSCTAGFGPVLDIYIQAQTKKKNRSYPWHVYSRSYGSDPFEVAFLGAFNIRQMKKNGILPIPKHLPGRGAATVNTDAHIKDSLIMQSQHEIEQVNMYPFRIAKQMGAKAFMVTHDVYTAYGDKPASINESIYKMIRAQLGQEVVLIADAQNTGAIFNYYCRTGLLKEECNYTGHGEFYHVQDHSPRYSPQFTLDALQRGADMVVLYFPPDNLKINLQKAINIIFDEVNRDPEFKKNIISKINRVRTWKQHKNILEPSSVVATNIPVSELIVTDLYGRTKESGFDPNKLGGIHLTPDEICKSSVFNKLSTGSFTIFENEMELSFNQQFAYYRNLNCEEDAIGTRRKFGEEFHQKMQIFYPEGTPLGFYNTIMQFLDKN